MNLTKAQREAIKQYIQDHTSFHADSIRIRQDGVVTARKDADKTFNGPHSEYLEVGSASDILRLSAWTEVR